MKPLSYMNSMSIRKQESAFWAKKRIVPVNQVGRVMACLLIVLFLHSACWADGIWDANKPGSLTSPQTIAPNDNSCWIASAADMMAADGWGGTDPNAAQNIYNYLIVKSNAGLDYTKGGFQAQAVRAMIASPGEFISDPNEILFEEGLGYTGAVPNARAVIDNLLTTPDASDLPGDILGESPDDPVGLGIYNDGDTSGNLSLAHAITVWSDGPTGLTVSDSDDTANGTVVLPWLANGEINYHGTAVYVGYISMLQDVPEPGILALACFGGITVLIGFRRLKNRQA
jgi:hypothetical protein